VGRVVHFDCTVGCIAGCVVGGTGCFVEYTGLIGCVDYTGCYRRRGFARLSRLRR
jgi:hypothetical protein